MIVKGLNLLNITAKLLLLPRNLLILAFVLEFNQLRRQRGSFDVVVVLHTRILRSNKKASHTDGVRRYIETNTKESTQKTVRIISLTELD